MSATTVAARRRHTRTTRGCGARQQLRGPGEGGRSSTGGLKGHHHLGRQLRPAARGRPAAAPERSGPQMPLRTAAARIAAVPAAAAWIGKNLKNECRCRTAPATLRLPRTSAMHVMTTALSAVSIVVSDLWMAACPLLLACVGSCVTRLLPEACRHKPRKCADRPKRLRQKRHE